MHANVQLRLRASASLQTAPAQAGPIADMRIHQSAHAALQAGGQTLASLPNGAHALSSTRRTVSISEHVEASESPDYHKLAKKLRQNFWVQSKRWLLWRDEVSRTDESLGLTMTLDIRGGVLFEAKGKTVYEINGKLIEHYGEVKTWQASWQNKLPEQVVAKLPKGVHITEEEVRKELAIAFSHFMEGFDDHLTLPASEHVPFAMTLCIRRQEVFIHTDHRFSGGGQKVALDVIRISKGGVRVWAELRAKKEGDFQSMIQEYKLVASVSGSHILPASPYVIAARQSMLQPKLKGDLRKLSKNASVVQRIVWVRQMFIAEQQLLNQRIIHRDIKPTNFLIDAKGKLYLTDLGIARRIEGNSKTAITTSEISGSRFYLAPELHAEYLGKGKGSCTYNEATELYALGMAIFILFRPELARHFPGWKPSGTRQEQIENFYVHGLASFRDSQVQFRTRNEEALLELVCRLTGPAQERGTIQRAIKETGCLIRLLQGHNSEFSPSVTRPRRAATPRRNRSSRRQLP